MRSRLYGGAKTKKIDVLLTEELFELLELVSTRHALEPAAYVRSLVVTHLNKLKASENV